MVVMFVHRDWSGGSLVSKLNTGLGPCWLCFLLIVVSARPGGPKVMVSDFMGFIAAPNKLVSKCSRENIDAKMIIRVTNSSIIEQEYPDGSKSTLYSVLLTCSQIQVESAALCLPMMMDLVKILFSS